jgi:hypothetical protein
MADPDYILDLSSLKSPPDDRGDEQPPDAAPAEPRPSQSLRGRPWLAIHWRCCSVYSRIYRSADATVYEGRCPRCGKPLRVAVGKGGTDSRFFEAS